ncbi:MAG: hypothetical protein LBS15_02315 [Endomicrobium sp.]|jgi:hypothetical protein|nr:hypothetical protein [Endomicrobium sp.]
MEAQLELMMSMFKLGRYEIVKLVLEQIEIIKKDGEYRKFTQVELINKALNDVLTSAEAHKKQKGVE